MLERLKLIIKFKLLTRALFARKRLYSLFCLSKEEKKLMINLGGGLFFRPHWKVMDYVSPYYPYSKIYIDFNIDLLDYTPLPLDDNSVTYFFSSHTLEHIPQENCSYIFRELYRCTKPGGAVRLTMPDYDLICQAFENKTENFFTQQLRNNLNLEEALLQRIATDLVGKIDTDEILKNYQNMGAIQFADHYCSRASREEQRRHGGNHINWFNETKLTSMLQDAGFSEVYRSTPHGSRFKELKGDTGFFEKTDFLGLSRMLGIDTAHPDKSLYVEAVK
ncbi:MAG: methyltransferase domain-containing protein [Rhodospirillaceae bacterium]